jgi:two-component system, NarL family, sensor kinase
MRDPGPARHGGAAHPGLLHPPALEALGLTRAIHDYAEGFARRSGIQVELDVAELPVRLPPDTELALFRVLQESLGNLHRHSGSATAAIRLAQDAETVVIEVRDTGCGLGLTGLAAATSGSACFGVGIAGMRERLRLLGGRLEIEAALPGVRVRATLPLSTTADE